MPLTFLNAEQKKSFLSAVRPIAKCGACLRPTVESKNSRGAACSRTKREQKSITVESFPVPHTPYTTSFLLQLTLAPPTQRTRANSLAKDHAISQLDQATHDLDNERKRVNLNPNPYPNPHTNINPHSKPHPYPHPHPHPNPFFCKSNRRESSLQYDLLQQASLVEDLELSLQQVVAGHVVASRESKKEIRYSNPSLPNPYLTTVPPTNPNPQLYPRLNVMATEVIQFQAQQATYELTAWARKAELQNDKLTKEIAVQVHKRKRVEESMENGKRELERQQRLINKHDRQLHIDQAALEHKQTLCLSMTDRLVYERKVIR